MKKGRDFFFSDERGWWEMYEFFPHQTHSSP